MIRIQSKILILVLFLVSIFTAIPAQAADNTVTLTSTAGELPLPVSHPRLDAARALVGADWTIENGFTGKGVSVAVIDSGIQGDHIQFSGRILKQVCHAHVEPYSRCADKKLFDKYNVNDLYKCFIKNIISNIFVFVFQYGRKSI